ncbi:hypothetical protein [Cohnella sp. WQ 127256]|uniref:hypothetical protein n=1 Tax=Cohnella sp. WQ 127256 TaxID=2938790 RepID=UPI0021189EAA|nr:hypothetical protein [Cohnella sp. WQ 127256]
MSFGDISYIDGFLFVTAYNANSGGPSPYQSHVVKYNTQDNGLNQITVNNIGTGVAEGIDKHLDDNWVSYHNIQKIRRFDASWVQKAEYNLPTVAKAYGSYQGIIWENGYLYANMHGPNEKGQDFQGGIDKFSFNGSTFTFVESFNPPSFGASQGMEKYNGIYLFNDRAENRIIICNSLKPGKVKAEVLRTPKQRLVNATLINRWEIFDTTYDRRPRYYKDETGRVHLSGMCKNTDSSYGPTFTHVIFQLPRGYRPKYSLNFAVVSNAAFARISITGNLSAQAAGQVVPQEGTSATWVSLDGISFLADPDGTELV